VLWCPNHQVKKQRRQISVFQTSRFEKIREYRLSGSNSLPKILHTYLSYVYWTVHRCDNWRIRDQLDVTIYWVLFHFFYAQHASDINTSIVRSLLRLFCCMTTLVVCSCFDVCWSIGVDGLGWYPCRSLLHGYHPNPATPKLQHTSKQEHTTNVVIQKKSPRLLMMDVLMSETCWA